MLLFHFIYSCWCKCGVHRIEMNTAEQRKTQQPQRAYVRRKFKEIAAVIVAVTGADSASADDDEYTLHTLI